MSKTTNPNKRCTCTSTNMCSARSCKVALRTCFGKRSDALFCYNDDKAKSCTSNWRPRNPCLCHCQYHCGKVANVPVIEITPVPSVSALKKPTIESESSHILQKQHVEIVKTSEVIEETPVCINKQASEKQVQLVVNCEVEDREEEALKELILPPPPPKCLHKMTRDILQLRQYLKNCMYHRMSTNWTAEDDAALIDCIYNNLVLTKGLNRVCKMLETILEQNKNVLLKNFLEDLILKFYEGGHCGPRLLNDTVRNVHAISDEEIEIVTQELTVKKSVVLQEKSSPIVEGSKGNPSEDCRCWQRSHGAKDKPVEKLYPILEGARGNPSEDCRCWQREKQVKQEGKRDKPSDECKCGRSTSPATSTYTFRTKVNRDEYVSRTVISEPERQENDERIKRSESARELKLLPKNAASDHRLFKKQGSDTLGESKSSARGNVKCDVDSDNATSQVSCRRIRCYCQCREFDKI